MLVSCWLRTADALACVAGPGLRCLVGMKGRDLRAVAEGVVDERRWALENEFSDGAVPRRLTRRFQVVVETLLLAPL